MEPIYLDHNATTPLAAEVSKAISDALDHWGNPSSVYEKGKMAKNAISKAREQIASMINSQSSEIIFCSGGTEANNNVVFSVLESFDKWKESTGDKQIIPHVITTNVEHVAVERPLRYWQDKGRLEVTFVPVDSSTGAVTVDAIMHAFRPATVLISIIMANNETGVIMPILEIGRALDKYRQERKSSLRLPLYFHTDAAQAIGKLKVDVKELNVDFLVIVGHKFYGPRIGALYVRSLGNEVQYYPMLFGGGQERGYRSGTENTPMIVGLGQAAETVMKNLAADQNHFRLCRDELECCLQHLFGDSIWFNFRVSNRLPNTTSVCISCDGKYNGYELLSKCPFVCASTGSACHSGSNPSAVLMASGLSEEKARSTLRLTVGRSTRLEDVRKAAEAIRKAYDSMACR